MNKRTMALLIIIFLQNNYFAQWAGNALHFDGLNDYVDFGNSSVFDVDTAVTYEVWIQPDSGASGFIFNKWVNFQEDKQVTYSVGSIGFYLYNAFGGTVFQIPSTVPQLQFTHLAAVYNGSEAKLYINGVLDSSIAVSSSVNNSSGNLYLGFNPIRFDVIAPFEGIIDEFRIWNTARTEAEIQSTMNRELNGNEPGLVGYWNFNEGTGDTTGDQTSNGNTGIISGATWVISGIPTDVEERVGIPELFNLSQNFPNPFNPSTTISYSIPGYSNVEIKIFGILGNEIQTLVNEGKPAGTYNVSWNSSGLPSGVYFYRISAGDFIESKKMILIK